MTKIPYVHRSRSTPSKHPKTISTVRGLFASLLRNFLSCCNGIGKNKFYGLWRCILVGNAEKSFTAKCFQDENQDATCFFLHFTLGNSFVLGYLQIDTKSSYFQYIKMLKKIKGMMLLNSGTVLCSSVF